jgi:hypothetical protein
MIWVSLPVSSMARLSSSRPYWAFQALRAWSNCKDETGVSIIYIDEEGLKQHCQYRTYNIINKLSIIFMFAAGMNVELIVEKINSIAFFRLKTRHMYIKYFITVRLSN